LGDLGGGAWAGVLKQNKTPTFAGAFKLVLNTSFLLRLATLHIGFRADRTGHNSKVSHAPNVGHFSFDFIVFFRGVAARRGVEPLLPG